MADTVPRNHLFNSKKVRRNITSTQFPSHRSILDHLRRPKYTRKNQEDTFRSLMTVQPVIGQAKVVNATNGLVDLDNNYANNSKVDSIPE